MGDKETPVPKFWIDDKDHRNRPLDPRAIEAARLAWEPVLRRATGLLKDPHVIVQIVDRIAATVSRILYRQDRKPIKDVPAYFLWACIRAIRKTAARERREVSGHELTDLDRIGARTAPSPEDALLLKVQVEGLISRLDERARMMIAMRSQEFSWDEIAARLGYANGHSAHVQYSKAIAAVRKSLGRPLRNPKAFGVDE